MRRGKGGKGCEGGEGGVVRRGGWRGKEGSGDGGEEGTRVALLLGRCRLLMTGGSARG